jgi:hypothetical protein
MSEFRITAGILGLGAMLFLSILAEGCYEAQHPIELNKPTALPVLASDIEAPKGAPPITFVRPRDLRSNQVIFEFKHWVEFIPVGEHRLIAGNDPAVWLGNGISAGLENAGYSIKRVDKPENADARYVVTSDLTQLQIQVNQGLFSMDCTADVGAAVQVSDAGAKIFEQSYDGQYKGNCHLSPSDALERALEDFLNQAIPAMAAAIAHKAQPTTASERAP